MLSQKLLRRHADLMDRMAKALGLDLEELILMGQLEVATVGDAVLACTGCTDAEGCDRWLAMQKGPASETPPVCRNSKLFSDLKAGRRI